MTSEPPPGVNPETLCAYAMGKARPLRAPARGWGLGGSYGRLCTRATDGDPTFTPKRRRARRNQAPLVTLCPMSQVRPIAQEIYRYHENDDFTH